MLGYVCYSLAQYKQAKECYGKVLIIQKKINVEENADVATTYNN